MKFGSGDSADSSTVEDRRGMGSRIGVAGGGLGVVGIVIVLIVRALGGDVDLGNGSGAPSDPTPTRGPAPGARTETTSASLSGSCEGVTAATDQAKFITCVETNVQTFWKGELPRHSKAYEVSKLVLFTDRTQSGCGGASAAMGPFYCPTDAKVYLDLGFFNQLKTKLGAQGGDFAEAYVVAHEYGHHVQDLLGISDRVQAQMGRQHDSERNATSVQLELQADCLAGVWGHSAYGAGKVDSSEVAVALDAAAAVGDDRIQSRARGRVNPESFTHGSAADRQKWFTTGMRTGDMNACNTFGH